MKTIEGDLIELALTGHFDIIVHGCNCFCTMGAGIARAIQNEFPEALAADMATKKGDRGKLGSYSQATVNRPRQTLTIVNGYTQYNYFGKGILVEYEAVSSLFARLKIEYAGSRIGYPKIGAGLAGGNWDTISAIIDRELAGADHTLVRYTP